MAEALSAESMTVTGLRPCGPVLAQHREREAVERAAVDAADAVAEQIRGPEQHFAAGLAGKREQQHVACRDALFRQPSQTVDDCAGFAAPRARDDQNRAVRRGHGFELGRVECRNVYHWNSVGRGCLRLSGRRRTHAFRRAGEIALRAMPVRFASPPNDHAFAAPWGKFPRPPRSRRNVLETVFRFGTLPGGSESVRHPLRRVGFEKKCSP